jgi:hypothetical protein
MSKMQFITNSKRSPDLAVIDDVILASLYDEIVLQEIKLKDEPEPAPEPAAEPPKPSLGRRMSLAIGLEMPEELLSPPASAATPAAKRPTTPRDFSFSEVGQRVYDVQQTGLGRLTGKVRARLRVPVLFHPGPRTGTRHFGRCGRSD